MENEVMGKEYIYPKAEVEKFLKKKFMGQGQFFFRNGDFFNVRGKEIVEYSLQFYDSLYFKNNCFYPVVRSGYFKLKLSIYLPEFDSSCLCGKKEYLGGRKKYLEKRCIEDNGIYFFRLFDSNRWSYGFLGDTICRKDGEFLIIEFQENKSYGSFDSENFTVKIRELTKRSYYKIYLDCENFDGFDVFHDEIKSFLPKFSRNLVWNSDGLSREIIGGFLRLKLLKDNQWGRKKYLIDNKQRTIKQLENRLCEEKTQFLNVCHMYVHCNCAGYGWEQEEKISVAEFFPKKLFEKENISEKEYEWFTSGYAERDEEGLITLHFCKDCCDK